MTPNLREQKRRATRSAIEDHATRLVAENGFECVTVEDICAAAQISRRTFFNYMESKEAAVLGSPPRELAERDITAFLAQRHPDLTSAILNLGFDLLLGTALDSDNAGVLLRRRKAIRRDNPQLSFTQLSSFVSRQEALARTTALYLEKYDADRILPSQTLAYEARSHVAVITAAIQLGAKHWMDSPSSQLTELKAMCDQALADIRTLTSERRPQ
ncbi:helix-turn-helix domain-containing protein [Corynebacterium sp. H128]|uniref:TetR/AcrR family transcriptional regulator n=1 Tax=unclassified Corynebacterium TaxID=2624378 RepID=UPI0030A12BD3